MLRGPIIQTHKTELLLATTRHVVAAFCLLDEHLTPRATFPLLEIKQEVLGTLFVRMHFHHALWAEFCVALGACRWGSKEVDHSLFALLDRTQAKVGVLDGLAP